LITFGVETFLFKHGLLNFFVSQQIFYRSNYVFLLFIYLNKYTYSKNKLTNRTYELPFSYFC